MRWEVDDTGFNMRSQAADFIDLLTKSDSLSMSRAIREMYKPDLPELVAYRARISRSSGESFWDDPRPWRSDWMTSHPLVAISNLLEPVEQRWVQGHPRDVVAGAGSNVPAPGEQRWVQGHPRDVVAGAILSAGLDEPACGAQPHLFPAPVNGAGNWDVPMRHGWGTERQPRGDFLFPHLANTPTHLLLLEALHRVIGYASCRCVTNGLLIETS